MNRLLHANALAIVIAFAPPPACATELPVSVDQTHCSAPLHATADHQRLRLRGTPGHRYRLWVEEHGVDIELQDPEFPDRMRDSAPARHAMEPLIAIADLDGAVAWPLRVMAREAGAELRIACMDARARYGLIERFGDLKADSNHRNSPASAIAAIGVAAAGVLVGSRSEREWFYFQLGALARAGGMLGESVAWARFAGAAAAMGSRRNLLAKLSEAQGLFRSSDYGAGVALTNVLADAAGMPFVQAVAQHDLCLVERVRGEVERAADCLKRAAQQFGALGETREQGNALRNRATALLMLGRYAEARLALGDAAARAEQSDSRRLRALVAQTQAQLATWAGDFERALSLLADAVTGLEAEGDVLEAIRTRKLIADTYTLSGDSHRALEYYRRVKREFERRGAFTRSATVLPSMARLMEEHGQHVEAIGLLDRATGELRERGTVNQWAVATVELARLHVSAGNRADALRRLELIGAEEASLSWKLRAEVDALRIRLGASPSRDDFAATIQRAYAGGHLLLYLDLAEAEIERLGRSERRAAAAALAAEAFARGLKMGRELRSPGLRHALLRRLQPFALFELRHLAEGKVESAAIAVPLAAMELLRELEQRPAISSLSGDLLDDLERRLAADALVEDGPPDTVSRDNLVLQIDAAMADFARPDSVPTAASFDDTQIAVGESLLYVVLQRTWGGALRKDHRGWYWLPSQDTVRLRTTTDAIRIALSGGHESTGRIDQLSGELADALRWSALMDEPAERVSIVADHALVGLPWGMLPAPGDATRLLGATSELVLLQSLRATPSRHPRSLHVLGAGSGPTSQLPKLAAAGTELRKVLEHWRELPSELVAYADREALAAALGRPGAIVHIAAHGRSDQGLAEESGLWMVDAGSASQFVSAVRLRHLSVLASLVVLSACESGYSQAARTFGVGGVAGSLIDAGAGAVVATRWPVSDRAALTFSDAFHETLSRDPEQLPAAVRAGVQAVAAVPVLRHPTHWAGWFLLQPGPRSIAAH